MENFKLFNGKTIDDLESYIKNYLIEYPDSEIYIGTDSRQRKDQTKYATCISFLRPMKGVHVIYKRKNLKRINDVYTRLWNEVEYSRETGEFIKNILNGQSPKITVHLDFNSNPKFKSFMVYDSAMGYITNLGFDAEGKPGAWCSSCCADLLVNKPDKIRTRKR